MADNTIDVRTKIDSQTHSLLTAVSQATGRDISEIVRGLLHDYLDSETRKARLIVANLPRLSEGVAGHGRD